MQFIINPGTESQTNHNEANAIKVANIIVKDLEGSKYLKWKRVPENDDDDGWYQFIFMDNSKREVVVDIPGITPETVVAGTPWVSPRLYVDGSSWLYGYALGFIAGDD